MIISDYYIELIDDYEEEVECHYRGEKYIVRDNGAIKRLPKHSYQKRKIDNVFLFGTSIDAKGYLLFGPEKAHRIVATAFCNKYSPDMVVDHIDTNRRNNRTSNLRWVTKEENNRNPITKRRLEKRFGMSYEELSKHPEKLKMDNKPIDTSYMHPISSKEERANKEIKNGSKINDDSPALLQDLLFLDEFVNSDHIVHDEHGGIVSDELNSYYQDNIKYPGKFVSIPKNENVFLKDYTNSINVGDIFYVKESKSEELIYRVFFKRMDRYGNLFVFSCSNSKRQTYLLTKIIKDEEGFFLHKTNYCRNFLSVIDYFYDVFFGATY